MLNTAQDASTVTPLFGFINRPDAPPLGFAESSTQSKGEFSMQLGALMMAEYKKGHLDLAGISDLEKMDPQSLQALAETLSFDVDLASEEPMFQQLSAWLAQQGLATAFIEPSLNSETLGAGLTPGVDDLGNLIETSLDTVPPGLVAESRTTQNAELDELIGEFKASIQTMLEALKTAESSEQKQLVINDFKQSLQKLTVFLTENDLSTRFNLDTDVSQDWIARLEDSLDSVESPLLADFIQNQLLPYAKQNFDAFEGALTADDAALQSIQPKSSEERVLEVLAELDEVLLSEHLLAEDLSDDDLARLEEIVGFVQTLQGQISASDNVGAVNSASVAKQVEQDVKLDLDAIAEEEVDPILAQMSVAIPASAQASQSAAPQGLAGMAQAAMNRQAPSSNGLVGQPTSQNSVNDLFSKSLQETQAPVQTLQQQLSQSNLQQQAMNLNLRDQVAQQQQETLKASDVKYKTAASEGEVDLLGIQPSSSERKSNAPALASIAYPLRHPQWAPSVGKRIIFMANQQMQQAQISLNPDKLGPIQLRLQLDRDQMVTVSMTAQHGATREALEAAIPRLKEMLEQAGIRFDDVKVEDEDAFEQGNHQQSMADEGVRAGGTNTADEAQRESPSPVKQTDNMIDFYA